MSIETACPGCGNTYKLPDRQEGKTVRCTSCDENFVVKPVATRASREESDDRITLERRKARPAKPRLLPSSYDEGDGPRSRRGGVASESKVMLLAAAGIVLLLLVLCGGGAFLVYRLAQSTTATTPPQDEVTVCLNDLKAVDWTVKRKAAERLAKIEVVPDRQQEVFRALEPLVSDSNAFISQAGGKALVRWATAENVPALISILNARAFFTLSDDLRHDVLLALGRLKAAKAAEPIAKLLPNVFEHEPAKNALLVIGPGCQDEVLKYLNHPEKTGHDDARALLKSYGTSQDALFAQTFKDLKADDVRVRLTALQWLDQQPVAVERRAEVASVLDPLLFERDGRLREDSFTALEKWATAANVPSLVRLYDDPPNPSFKGRICTLLAQFPDERAAAMLASHLTSFHERREVSKALQQMGRIAEAEVLPYVADKDAGARLEACRILKVIGTRASVAALRKATQDGDGRVQQAALAALKAVQARP